MDSSRSPVCRGLRRGSRGLWSWVRGRWPVSSWPGIISSEESFESSARRTRLVAGRTRRPARRRAPNRRRARGGQIRSKPAACVQDRKNLQPLGRRDLYSGLIALEYRNPGRGIRTRQAERSRIVEDLDRALVRNESGSAAEGKGVGMIERAGMQPETLDLVRPRDLDAAVDQIAPRSGSDQPRSDAKET